MNPELHMREVHKLVKTNPKRSKHLKNVCGIPRLEITKLQSLYTKKFPACQEI